MTVQIRDRGCGTGKTTEMMATLNRFNKYLIVVPLLSEVDRVLDDAEIDLCAPSDFDSSKADSLTELIAEGKSVVTTHSLYSRLVELARSGALDDYHIIVDEVPDTVKEANLKRTKRDDIKHL